MEKADRQIRCSDPLSSHASRRSCLSPRLLHLVFRFSSHGSRRSCLSILASRILSSVSPLSLLAACVFLFSSLASRLSPSPLLSRFSPFVSFLPYGDAGGLLPSCRRHCLCPVFSLHSCLRRRLCLVFPLCCRVSLRAAALRDLSNIIGPRPSSGGMITIPKQCHRTGPPADRSFTVAGHAGTDTTGGRRWSLTCVQTRWNKGCVCKIVWLCRFVKTTVGFTFHSDIAHTVGAQGRGLPRGGGLGWRAASAGPSGGLVGGLPGAAFPPQPPSMSGHTFAPQGEAPF